MKEEIWKDVTGFEGKYQVSNTGKIRSMAYHKKNGLIKELKPFSDKGGYMRVKFCKDGKESTVKVHRIVATEFIPNPHNKREVNHIDGNHKNNTVENLEWVTPSENMIHAAKYGLVVSPIQKPVEQRTLNGDIVKTWPNARVAALNTDTDPSSITKCCKWKLRQTNGYQWCYSKQDVRQD